MSSTSVNTSSVVRTDPPRAQRAYRASRLLMVASLVVVIGAWQLSSAVLPNIFISTPSRVISDFAVTLGTGKLPVGFIESVWNMFVGFGIATVGGITLGVLMGRFRIVETVADPFVSFFIATPTVALLPLMEIWFGFGMWARVSFIIVVCVWTIIINSLNGIKNVPKGYNDVGVAFGLSSSQQLRYIHVQAAMPYILAGIRVALAQGAVGMILSGQEIGVYGLGGMLQTYGQYFQTGHLEAAIIASAILMFLAFGGLRRFQSRFYPWIAATSAGQR